MLRNPLILRPYVVTTLTVSTTTTMTKRLALFVLLLVAVPASAQQVVLTPYPTDGTYDVQTSLMLDMTITIEPEELTAETMEAASQEQKMVNEVMRYGTLEVVAEGDGHALRYVEDRIVLNVTTPMSPTPMSFDSDSPEGANPQLAAAGAAVGVPMEVLVIDGESTFANRDEYLDTLVGDVPDEETREMQRSLIESTMANAQLAMLGNVGGLLPPGSVAVGDAWDVVIPTAMAGADADMTGTMTVTSIDGDEITFGGPLAMAGTMTMNGIVARMNGSGTTQMTFDRITGASTSATDMDLTATAAMPAAAGMAGDIMIRMDMTTNETRTLR